LLLFLKRLHAFDSAPAIELVWRKQSFARPPSIPSTFTDAESYRSAFIAGIVYELNAQIQEVYKLYTAALFCASVAAPKCREHGPTQFRVDQRGGYFFACKQCRFRQNVSPDAVVPDRKNVRLISGITRWMHSRSIGYHESTFLRNGSNCTLRFSDEKVDSVEYAKDDLWVLFSDSTPPLFAAADSFGVSQRHRVELSPFFDSRLLTLPTQLRLTAVRLQNAQTERATLSRLLALDSSQIPVLSALLSGLYEPSRPLPSADAIPRIASGVAARFNLNDDQRSSLSRVAEFIGGGSPIVLVHGVFGSGKSRLHAVIGIFLHEALESQRRSDKVLLAASTNVAVDNVLTNLHGFEFPHFARVGSVRKIRRSLLPFVSGHGSDEAIAELSSIAVEANRTEQPAVQEALRNARTELGGGPARIDAARIVGVTCAATAFPVFARRRFTFVLLDECSQQTEPMSLLPIAFGCERLICSGDPLHKRCSRGIWATAFLENCPKFPPVLLGTQYRCHPAIAQICSRLFYEGKIRSGIEEKDRSTLFGMPTLWFERGNHSRGNRDGLARR
jgi:hypothetical protein